MTHKASAAIPHRRIVSFLQNAICFTSYLPCTLPEAPGFREGYLDLPTYTYQKGDSHSGSGSHLCTRPKAIAIGHDLNTALHQLRVADLHPYHPIIAAALGLVRQFI